MRLTPVQSLTIPYGPQDFFLPEVISECGAWRNLKQGQVGPTNIKTNTQNKNVLHFINKLSNISVIHPVYHQLASPSCPFLFNIQNAFRESLKSVLPSSSQKPNKYLCSLTCIIIFPKKSHAHKKEALLLKLR